MSLSRMAVGIVGASGYSGAIAARLVAAHPRLSLAFATSDKLQGESVSAHLGVGCDAALRFVPNAAALETAASSCDLAILATSAEVSMKLLPPLAEAGKPVVDLSGAFRLDAGEYPRWYKFEHTAPRWLERAHYGLPEIFGAPPAGGVVANPGCYPTAAILPLAPLLREGLVEASGIVIDAKSGVTGAGRQATEAYSFTEVDGDLRAYKVFAHQHTPEITRVLARTSKAPVKLTFTAHLLPLKRGLLATCYARPRSGATTARLVECLSDAYRTSAFVRVVAPEQVMIKRVAGTNACHLGVVADDDVVIAVGALDNLLKGASGQAIQNVNLMNGWDEALGLDALQRISP